MIAPYSFHRLASLELDEAAAFYDSDHAGLGLLFIGAVERAVNQVRGYPESCEVQRDRSRKKLVDGFPYTVIYSYVGEHVRILAIAHHRRRPFFWSGRY